MSACTRLPQELIAAIADIIQNDLNSLKDFSLVCRAWTNAARDRLFSKLTINQNFFDRLNRTRTNLDVLSIFTPFLRHLHVMSTLQPEEFWSKAIPLLVDFQTPRLRTLALTRMTWHSLRPCERSAFLSRFGSVTSLRLDTRTMRLADVTDIICSWPQLETLIFLGNRADYRVPPPPSPRLFLPQRLSTLLVGVSPDAYIPFLEWLLSFPETPRLRTLYLPTLCMRSSYAGHLNKFLKALGPSLEIIRCGIFGANIYRQYLIDFTHNNHLRSIHFEFASITSVSENIQIATQMLSQMSSAKLETITLNIGAFNHLDAAAWIELDAILARPPLKKVHIWYTPPTTVVCTPTLFAMLLPACHARDIISYGGTFSSYPESLACWET